MNTEQNLIKPLIEFSCSADHIALIKIIIKSFSPLLENEISWRAKLFTSLRIWNKFTPIFFDLSYPFQIVTAHVSGMFEMLDDQVNEGKNAHRANPVDETNGEAKTDQSHSEQDKAQGKHSW